MVVAFDGSKTQTFDPWTLTLFVSNRSLASVQDNFKSHSNWRFHPLAIEKLKVFLATVDGTALKMSHPSKVNDRIRPEVLAVMLQYHSS
jgi:hypothetical protein